MLNPLFAHGYALRQSWQQLWQSKLSSLVTIAVLSICVMLPLWLYVGFKNVHHVTQAWQTGAQLTLFVDATLPEETQHTLLRSLKHHALIESVKYQSPKAVLAELGPDTGFTGLLDALPTLSLPAVVTVQPNTTDPIELATLKLALGSKPGVQEVLLDTDWVQKAQAFLHLFQQAALLLVLALSVGSILMIHNTLKLTFARHKDAFFLQDLLGATAAFIRRPFLYRGAFYGFLSAWMALCLTFVAAHKLSPTLTHFLSAFGNQMVFKGLSLLDMGVAVVISTALGWAGARLAALNLQVE